jgi:H+/gluconate symporter-like permease
MMTTAAVVMLITVLGALLLNWRGLRASTERAGWSGQKQVQIALIWLIIIGAVTVLIQRFAA